MGKDQSKMKRDQAGNFNYIPPSNDQLKPEDVAKHTRDYITPYFQRLKDAGLLIKGKFLLFAFMRASLGEKNVIDHHGDTVLVKGTLLNGVLTGYGNYVDPKGHAWSASFVNDKKHGTGAVIHVNGNVQISDLFNGVYHGWTTMYCSDGQVTNKRHEKGDQTHINYITERLDRAFYRKDASAHKAYEKNWQEYLN